MDARRRAMGHKAPEDLLEARDGDFAPPRAQGAWTLFASARRP